MKIDAVRIQEKVPAMRAHTHTHTSTIDKANTEFQAHTHRHLTNSIVDM